MLRNPRPEQAVNHKYSQSRFHSVTQYLYHWKVFFFKLYTRRTDLSNGRKMHPYHCFAIHLCLVSCFSALIQIQIKLAHLTGFYCTTGP